MGSCRHNYGYFRANICRCGPAGYSILRVNMKTLDDIINCVQTYAHSQDRSAPAYKIEAENTQYTLLWQPDSLRELVAIRNPYLFIFFAYQAILGRAPDHEGERHYHDLLTSGRISLRKFALHMLSSTESAESRCQIKINKIDRCLIILENKILSLWRGRKGAGLVGRLHDSLIKLSTFNTKYIQRNATISKQNYDIEISQEKTRSAFNLQQRKFISQIETTYHDITSNITKAIDQKNNQFDIQQKILNETIASNALLIQDQFKENTELLNKTLEKNNIIINQLLCKNEEKLAFMANTSILNGQASLYLIERILKHHENTNSTEHTAARLNTASASFDSEIDSYYLAFEAKFRGSEHEIKSRLEKYTPYIETFLESSQATLLDIGMGRGEWLKLISDKGLKAQGVDQSEEMIHHCRAIGLSVVHADALNYLIGLPDQSLGAISSFHVIEHLSFDVLFNILKNAYRTLLPGGVLILETPNPENILVGSHTFYHDFSHKNPVTPASLQFLAEYHGFKDCEILRLNPYPESAKVPGNDLLTERVNGHLCGPQDYALIAKR
ncbi:methyltransferase domain-containing protein [Iodobacter ciconiae]|uniref:Methyltransferase domain-containing protein n=1 Tax=Iodobacter ciconiae TaxID=2496266 RepID=A0A3S8ZWP0_9NEIS|nr:methyltransferase domain-containing protein [Iodobacter ciconiae]AZN37868.1 methyltransferase domain-containing protein [Iodobacter ciconiae]